MTIALFGISSIYNNIQKFLGATTPADNNFQFDFTGSRAAIPTSTNLGKSTGFQTKQRALRILRISEQGEATSCAGRMVISGRMADVCAELDRLVALEAQNKPSLTH
jgi:hypothetical protein